MNSVKPVRDSNFELLRILSMFMIMLLHTGTFGVQYYIDVTESLSGANQFLYHLIRSLAIVAVSLYVMVSGYYLACSQFKLYKTIKLFLAASFFSVVIYLIFVWTGYVEFEATRLIASLFAILTGQYWFVTAYFAMYLIFPFLNRLADNLSQWEHLQLLLSGFLINSIWQFFQPNPIIGIASGYSLLQFVFLYFMGNYVRKYDFIVKDMNKYTYLAIYLLGAIVNSVLFNMTGDASGLLYDYNSPLIIMMAYCLFMFFKHLAIKSRPINWGAKYVFGLYLIHEQSSFRKILWQQSGLIEPLLELPSAFFIVAMLGMSVAIFMVMWLLSYVMTTIYDILYAGAYRLFTKHREGTAPDVKPNSH